MISDDELLGLPDDPELAFVQLEQILRRKMNDWLEKSEGHNTASLQIEYINRVLAAKKAFNLDILNGWEVPRTSQAVFEVYANFTSDVDHYTMEIRVRHTRRVKQYSVALDATAKAKLRHLLTQMRETVDRLEVSIKKKEAFYAKIAALESEVDRERTRFDAVAALYVEACDKIGEGVEKLEPVRKWVDSMAGLISKAKQDEDKRSPGLPAPHERKRIEPPRERRPSAEQPFPDVDDEIPF